jgi:hypothetical protein
MRGRRMRLMMWMMSVMRMRLIMARRRRRRRRRWRRTMIIMRVMRMIIRTMRFIMRMMRRITRVMRVIVRPRVRHEISRIDGALSINNLTSPRRCRWRCAQDQLEEELAAGQRAPIFHDASRTP